MCHDGATFKDLAASSPNEEDCFESQDDSEKDEHDRKTRLRSVIASILKGGRNVALINGMNFHDTKVWHR